MKTIRKEGHAPAHRHQPTGSPSYHHLSIKSIELMHQTTVTKISTKRRVDSRRTRNDWKNSATIKKYLTGDYQKSNYGYVQIPL